MMGEWLVDELAIESSHKGKIRGMGLFPETNEEEKYAPRQKADSGNFTAVSGNFPERD